MKVYIVGGGPTGLFTAIVCTKLGIPCEVFERSDRFGGHHNMNDRTMHAPRMLSWNAFRNMRYVLESIGYTPRFVAGGVKADYFTDKCTVTDVSTMWYKVFVKFPFYQQVMFKTPLQEEISCVSPECRAVLNQATAYIAARSDDAPSCKMAAAASWKVIDSLKMRKGKIMADDNRWWEHMVSWLEDHGVPLHKNTMLQSCETDGKRVTSLGFKGRLVKMGPTDHVALCMDPQGFKKLLRTQKSLVANWGHGAMKHLKHSMYHSIGFRVDLDGRLPPNKWFLSTVTDWEIIMRPRRSGTQMDCVVCDLTKVSGHTKKSILVTPPEEFKTEVSRQLQKHLPCNVVNIEFHDDTWFAKGKWHNKHTAVAINAKYGFFPSQGRLQNIHFVSPMTWRTYVITTVETCCEVAIRFVNRISSTEQFPLYEHGQYSLPYRAQVFLIPNTLLLLVIVATICTIRKTTSILASNRGRFILPKEGGHLSRMAE